MPDSTSRCAPANAAPGSTGSVASIMADATLALGEKLLMIEALFAHDHDEPCRSP